MKHIILEQVRQESRYRYAGIASFESIAGLCSGYAFSEEVLEKAELQKEILKMGTSAFQIVLRVDPDCRPALDQKDRAEFCFETFEVVDGRSKAAALTLLEPEYLTEKHAVVHIFTVSEEKMKEVQG